MNNNVLLILKRKFDNKDIITKIYDIYLIDKYFSNIMNNKSIKLLKTRYIKDVENLNRIVKIINPQFHNMYYIRKLLITPEITLELLYKIPILIKNLEYKYKNNAEIMIKLCKKDKTIIKYASQELKSDINFINKMIDIYPSSIYYAKKELRDNYDLALKAILMDGDTIEYISERLQNNIELIMIAKKTNFNYF
jgi:hypothetical protein